MIYILYRGGGDLNFGKFLLFPLLVFTALVV